MSTRFYLPENIFCNIFLSEIKDKSEYEIKTIPSSLVSKSISEDQNSIGLIPTLDLLTNKELSVSSRFGISFDALLSNAYIHFKKDQTTIEEIFLKGDISSNEVILSKILFKEFYGVTVKTTLLSQEPPDFNENILIIGDENFKEELFLNGLSFSEEIIDLIKAPYVNFVLAGKSDDIIKNFHSDINNVFENGHEEKFNQLFPNLPQSALDFISVNIQHVIFDFDEQDIEGIKLLLQMPYYHGLLKDMIDVKFV